LTGWRLALDKSPQVLSVLLLFFLPLVTQPEGVDSIFPKWALAQTLIFLMLIAWLLRITLDGKWEWVYSRALLAMVLFLVWVTVTLTVSPYGHAGFQAFRDSVCFPLWYILLTFTCLEVWKAENLLIGFLAGGLFTSLWAVSQVLGLGEGAWLAIVRTQFQGRATAGMGNPDFLAGYLLTVWPMALALLMRAQKTAAKVFWAFLFICSLAALLSTGSKAGWLGFAAGLLVFVFFVWKDKIGNGRQWLLVLVAMLILSLFIPPMSGRLMELASGHGDSIRFRREVWSGVVQMIRDRPLQGTGFGTFEAAYPAYRPLSLMMHQAERNYDLDHAHNWVLEWAAETGVVGLFLMLAFWFFVLAQWWKLYRANAIPKSLAVGFFAVAAGVGVDNLFDLNGYLASTQVPLLFLAALPVALSQRFFHLEGYPIRHVYWSIPRLRILLLPVFVLGVAVAVQQVGGAFRRQTDNVLLGKAETASRGKNWAEALDFYGKILEVEPQNLEARYFRASVYLDEGKIENLEKALWDLQAVERVEPDFVQVHFKEAQALQKLGRMDESAFEMKKAIGLDPLLVYGLEPYQAARRLADGKQFEDAITIYQKLVLDYPTCVPVLVDYANCLVMLKRGPEAVGLYQKALKLDPENPEASADLKMLQHT
jgi:O-antigen ligase